MKRLLLAAIILSLAVFASAYSVRAINQQITLETLDIMTYVTAPAGSHDANWHLSVTDGIDVVSTTTHLPIRCRVETKMGPTGLCAWAMVDMQAFTSTSGPSAGTEITWTLTYLPNTDEATNHIVFSFVIPTGTSAVWRHTGNGLHLVMPDSIILGDAPADETLTITSEPTNQPIWMDGADSGFTTPHDFVNPVVGSVFTINNAAYTWEPANYTVVEGFVTATVNFVGTLVPDTYTYNLYVNGPDGYAVTGPVAGTTDYLASNPDVTALVGAYTIGAAPENYHWEVNPINVVATDFVEQTGGKSTRAHRIFNHTITFVLVEDTPPPAYTITITAADAETNEPLVANIYIDGVDSGYDTPYTFTEGVDYLPGVYTVVLDGYTDWIPESVTFPAVLTHDYTTNFIGTREQVTPVELSSFSATLTANLFVKLTWVSQSETNMIGYRVYRNTSANIADAEMLDIPMVPATNTSSSATYTVTDSNVLENNTYYYWLETIDYHETQFFGPTSVFVESVTPPVTNQTKIVKSGPNPFKIGDTYNIQLDVKTGETGTVTIYNVIGQVVRTYSVTGGSNQLVKWDGKDSRGNTCGSGIYFYKLSTPSVNQSKKIVVVK